MNDHRHLPHLLTISACCAILVLLSGCATSGLGRKSRKETAGKTFVIIGASSGFGRGVAEKLGSYGANVVLAARRKELLEEVAGIVRNSGGTALVVPTDISKPGDVQALADAAIARYGHIDVWINDVGVGAIGRFWDIPLEDYSRLIDVNLKGFVYGTQIALKQFRVQGSGTIINLGSIDSEVPLAYQAVYAATKAAIRSMDQAVNQELRLAGHRKRIRIVTIEPWAVDTPWWGHAANYSGHAPRMAAMDPPGKVVNAIIWASRHRRRELPVGWKAKTSWTMHHIAPHFTEWFSAQIAHRSQMRNAPPAPPTDGSLHQPMESGRGVDDGVRKRIKEENRQRKALRKD